MAKKKAVVDVLHNRSNALKRVVKREGRTMNEKLGENYLNSLVASYNSNASSEPTKYKTARCTNIFLLSRVFSKKGK